MSGGPSPDRQDEFAAQPDAAIKALRRELASHPKPPAPRRKPILPAVLAVTVSAGALAAVIWAANRYVDWDDALARVGIGGPASPGDAATVAEDDPKASESKAPRNPGAVKTTPASRPDGPAPAGQQLSGSSASDIAAVAGTPQGTTPSADQAAGRPPAEPQPGPAAPSRVAPAATTAVDDTIYSERDRDVIPPRTSEKLPGPALNSRATRSNTMEVIVSKTGTVERVRLVTPMQGMNDMVVLGWAKNWTFTPAMKDGHPVRYRLMMTWEMNP